MLYNNGILWIDEFDKINISISGIYSNYQDDIYLGDLEYLLLIKKIINDDKVTILNLKHSNSNIKKLCSMKLSKKELEINNFYRSIWKMEGSWNYLYHFIDDLIKILKKKDI